MRAGAAADYLTPFLPPGWQPDDEPLSNQEVAASREACLQVRQSSSLPPPASMPAVYPVHALDVFVFRITGQRLQLQPGELSLQVTLKCTHRSHWLPALKTPVASAVIEGAARGEGCNPQGAPLGVRGRCCQTRGRCLSQASTGPRYAACLSTLCFCSLPVSLQERTGEALNLRCWQEHPTSSGSSSQLSFWVESGRGSRLWRDRVLN